MDNKDSEKLKDLAQKVIKNSGLEKEEKFGSVVMILMVISIILTAVRVLQECNKNKASLLSSKQDKYNLYGEDIKTFSLRQGWFTKMRIKKIIRKELSPDDYRQYSLKLLSGILTTGENITDDEVMTLVEASNV